jgi:hypothetical protein
MCFDCSAFQYQLDKTKPLKDHVFQTIFLNNKDEDMWQKNEIKKDTISELYSQEYIAVADRQFVRIGGTSFAIRGRITPLSYPSSGH